MLFAKRDSHVFVRLEGRATHALGTDFDHFLTRLWASGDFVEIVIDLTATTSLDSTILGFLARIAKWMHQHRRCAPTLLCSSDKIAATVHAVGLDRLVSVVPQHSAAPENLQDVPTVEATRNEKARAILAAHRELMSLNERNASEFKSVVDCFERELREQP